MLDGQRFTPLATLPGMAERTIKIGSAGKIFSLTGWKVGWMVAAPELAERRRPRAPVPDLLDAPNLQAAVAFGLNEGDAWIAADAGPLRTRPRPDDARACATPVSPCSTPPRPISCASTSPLRGSTLDDEAFAAAAVEKAGVAVVPISAFAEQDPPRHLVRLCFGKKDETIEAGVAAMAKARELLA